MNANTIDISKVFIVINKLIKFAEILIFKISIFIDISTDVDRCEFGCHNCMCSLRNVRCKYCCVGY